MVKQCSFDQKAGLLTFAKHPPRNPDILRGLASSGNCCSWCRKEKSEVFTVAFGDRSFCGPMCWNDLRCAIRLKAGGAGQAETASSATEAGDDA
jgi:hypothetical protein